jgi:hypothetical protein
MEDYLLEVSRNTHIDLGFANCFDHVLIIFREIEDTPTLPRGGKFPQPIPANR